MNSRALTLILFIVLVVTGKSQTTEEYSAYDIAVREMEYAQRLVKEGVSLSSTPDMKGLDKATDNSAIRKRGQEQIARGKALGASAQIKIKRFQERQAEIKKILANKDRRVELVSMDGRQGVFAIESITPPMVNLIRPDMVVNNITIDQLSKESQNKLMERLEPNVELVCDTSYGAHFFPIAYLARSKVSDSKKAILPVFCVRVKVTPTSKNIAKDGNFEIKTSSAWPAFKPKSQIFPIGLVEGESDVVELPIELDEKQLDGRRNEIREINIQIEFGQNSAYTSKVRVLEHGLDELPIYIQESSGRILDTKYLSACYVDETFPEFEAIKKRAIDLKLVTSFTGNPNDIAAVKNELFSVWHYLAERGVQYGGATETAVVGNDFASQAVHSPSPTIAFSRMSCIDGSIFIASFAMCIGLDPILIVRPGHMYIAIKNSAGQYFAIETTTISNLDIDPEWSAEKKTLAIRSNFESAQKNGLQNLTKGGNSLERGLTVSRYQPENITSKTLVEDFQFVDVRQARYSGIPRILIKSAN